MTIREQKIVLIVMIIIMLSSAGFVIMNSNEKESDEPKGLIYNQYDLSPEELIFDDELYDDVQLTTAGLSGRSGVVAWCHPIDKNRLTWEKCYPINLGE